MTTKQPQKALESKEKHTKQPKLPLRKNHQQPTTVKNSVLRGDVGLYTPF